MWMKDEDEDKRSVNDYWNRKRADLSRKFGGLGYRECPLCGCPIRQPLFQDPITGELSGRGMTGTTMTVSKRLMENGTEEVEIKVEVELRMMCEVCWQENSGQEGDWWSGSSRYRSLTLGRIVDVWV